MMPLINENYILFQLGWWPVFWWQLPVIMAALAMLFVLAPRLIARSCRKSGLPVPPLADRCTQSFLVFLATSFGLFILVLFFGATSLLSGFWFTIIVPALGLVVLAWVVWSYHRKHPRTVQLAYGLATAIATLALVTCFLASAFRMQLFSQRAIDSMRLNNIGKALAMYSTEPPEGSFPPDLRTLVNMNQQAAILLACRGSQEKSPPDKPYTGPCDFKYIHPTIYRDDLVVVWEPVEFHNGEGGAVLYQSGKVSWLSADKLQAEVQRTEQWNAAHPATQPASQPATAPTTQPAINSSPATAARD